MAHDVPISRDSYKDETFIVCFMLFTVCYLVALYWNDFPIDEIRTKNVHKNKNDFPVGLITLPYQEIYDYIPCVIDSPHL